MEPPRRPFVRVLLSCGLSGGWVCVCVCVCVRARARARFCLCVLWLLVRWNVTQHCPQECLVSTRPRAHQLREPVVLPGGSKALLRAP